MSVHLHRMLVECVSSVRVGRQRKVLLLVVMSAVASWAAYNGVPSCRQCCYLLRSCVMCAFHWICSCVCTLSAYRQCSWLPALLCAREDGCIMIT